MHTHNPTRGYDRAFSILELVVVIAVIATLVSLLLPALASSRESARRVVCASNIRTLCTAVLTYSQANRDCIPVTEYPFNRTTRLQTSVLAQPFEALRSELGDPPDWSSFGPARCPSDDRVGPVVGFGYHYVAASWFVWPTTPPAERTKIFNETQGEYRQGEHKLLWMDLDTSAHAGSRRLQDGLYHLGYTDGSVELLSRPGHPFDADYWLNR
jgi:prepilin-type N-terminal cleavage/methylation domain-containing protein